MSRIPVEVPDAKIVLDGDPLEALTHMAGADVLVAARSRVCLRGHRAVARGGRIPIKMARAPPERPRFTAERVSEMPRAGVGFRKHRSRRFGGACGRAVSHKRCWSGRAVGVPGPARGPETSSATMTWPSSTVGGRLFDDCRKRIAAAPIRIPATSSTQPSVMLAPSASGLSLDDDDEPVAPCSSSSSAFLGAVGVPVLIIIIEAPEGHVVVVFAPLPASFIL